MLAGPDGSASRHHDTRHALAVAVWGDRFREAPGAFMHPQAAVRRKILLIAEYLHSIQSLPS